MSSSIRNRLENLSNRVSETYHERPLLFAAGVTATLVGTYIVRSMSKNFYRSDRAKHSLNVVVTGGSKGLGRGIARKFLELGDDVVICSRRQQNVDSAVEDLGNASECLGQIYGSVCDVGDPDQMKQFVEFAFQMLGHIDIWINNAGIVDGGQPLWETEVNTLQTISNVNLMGSVYAVRELILKTKPETSKRIHIFNTAGMGTEGRPSVDAAMYGATKRSLLQFADTVNAELKKHKRDGEVAVHTYQPGMIVTELMESLMRKRVEEYRTKKSQRKPQLKVVNALCASTEEVADAMVPILRNVCVKNSRGGQYPRFLTGFGVLGSFAKMGLGLGTEYFDENGRVRDEYRRDIG